MPMPATLGAAAVFKAAGADGGTGGFRTSTGGGGGGAEGFTGAGVGESSKRATVPEKVGVGGVGGTCGVGVGIGAAAAFVFASSFSLLSLLRDKFEKSNEKEEGEEELDACVVAAVLSWAFTGRGESRPLSGVIFPKLSELNASFFTS